MKKITIFNIILLSYLLYRFLFCYSYLPELIIPDSYRYKGPHGIISFKKYGIFKNQYKLKTIEEKMSLYTDKFIEKLNIDLYSKKKYSDEYEKSINERLLIALKRVKQDKLSVYSFKCDDKILNKKYNFKYICFLIREQKYVLMYIYNIDEDKFMEILGQ